MIVLIACEESQAVCTAFRNQGHKAFSCDVQECSGNHPEWHIQADVLPLINGNCRFHTMDGKGHSIRKRWDLIIAHPPCTFLSNAGACRLYPKKGQLDPVRFGKGIQARAFFMQLWNADCPRIAIENPVPSTVFDLPKHSQEIQPFQFGHPYTKKNAPMAEESALAGTHEYC